MANGGASSRAFSLALQPLGAADTVQFVGNTVTRANGNTVLMVGDTEWLISGNVFSRDEAPRFSASELVAAYSIDVVAHSDFFWVFVTRAFYYMGISLQAFLLFMMRDVQQVRREPEPSQATHYKPSHTHKW